MDNPVVSIIIACYNEESLLEQSVVDIVATMDASAYTYELIFIDDASQDRTPELIRKICDGRANFRYLCHTQNVGRGGTVTEGLRLAHGKVAGFLDVDLEVHPKYIPSLVSSIESGTCEVGTIARTYNYSWHPTAFIRTALSIGYRKIVGMSLSLPFTDTETGYKFFDRKRIMPILDECQNKGWFWDTEVMALSHQAGLRVLEIPGLFVRRHDKKSSVKLFRDTLAYAKELAQFRRRTSAPEPAGIHNIQTQPKFANKLRGLAGKVHTPAFISNFQHLSRKTPGFAGISTSFLTPRMSLTLGLSGLPAWFQSQKNNISRQLGLIGAKMFDRFEQYVLKLAALSILLVVTFLSYHAMVITYPNYEPIEKMMALGLLACEIFFAVNGIGYIFWITRSRKYQSFHHQYLSKQSSSSVACLLPVCDEPIETISETVASVCAMRYENKRVYILDDSSKEESIRNISELAKASGATLIRRKNRRHYKAGNINNALKQIKTDYIAVFDADQRPALDFLRDLVPLLDEDSGVALVQTPQDYENSDSLIAHAAALQNALFYEYIAESKDVTGSMFCCGTNFVMRLKALREIDGFDTATITEDFATTLKLHARGWKTRFHDKLYVIGLGPETLGEYLKQYSRWATGTLQVLKAAVKMLVTNPRALSPKQWFEYWLSCSYYLSGLVNFFLLLLPAAYMLFGINLIRGNPLMYLLLFFVVFMSFWSFFLFTSIKRGYPAGQLITVCARLETCKFYVYTKAFFSALLGRKPSFQVTDKGGSRQLDWSYLTVPLVVLAINTISVLIGLYRLGVVFHPYLAINTFWSAYNVWQLSAIIQYNSGSEFKVSKFFSLFSAGKQKARLNVPARELE